jgi:hypothetical protein
VKKILTVLFMTILFITGCAQPQEPQEEAITPTLQTPSAVQIPTSSGATYYVAIDGNDSNPGTVDQPWATIQYAADTMVAGDTLFIRGGTYHQNIRTSNDGNTSDGFITFAAYEGETPIIDGKGTTGSQNGFIIINDYIRLFGLELQNWDEDAIWIEGSGNLEISYCRVHDVCCGIGAAEGTHDFVFNKVEAYHFDLYGFDISPSGGADCYNGAFNECLSHSARDRDQNVDGFALGHGSQHGFTFNRCQTYSVFDGFDISSRDTVLNACTAHDCWNGGYKLWQDNVRLINCLGYHNDITNVELDWDNEAGVTTLFNCTFVDAGTFNIWVENEHDSLHMYNCIIAGGGNNGLTFEQRSIDNYRGDYNIFHNDNTERIVIVGYEDEFSSKDMADGQWASYCGQDSHSLSISDIGTLFQDLAAWDLHLASGSPAIDAGTPSDAPAEDYDGNSRPQGDGYDIGAYEHSQ